MKTILAAIAALAAALPAEAATNAPAPRLSMPQARAIALKAAPGKVRVAEYELEDGTWRYSFDIIQGKRVHEIGVDAMTGKIIENASEAPGAKD